MFMRPGSEVCASELIYVHLLYVIGGHRVQISAGHNREQLDRCIEAFIKVGRELGVLK